LKKEILRRLATDEELKESDVVIALSFGRRPLNAPGLSNEYLAKIVESLYEKYKHPLILQKEIACFLCPLPKEKIIEEHREYKKDGKTKKYLDTFEVLVQAKEVCMNKGWAKIILVAHQDHLPRVIKVAENLLFMVRIPLTGKVPYDKKSDQRWTRGKIRFAIYEKLATFIYSRKGKI